jgi:uncharacterized protein YqfB (UPF0267 family)
MRSGAEASGESLCSTAAILKGEFYSMGLYNFQERFVPFILDGRKTHTIRATRSNIDRPGNTLHLYTGLRQKGARLLMRVPCTCVQEIVIDRFGLSGKKGQGIVRIDGYQLGYDECEELARRDGFLSFSEMLKFWDGRLPFRGHIIHWKKS